MKEFIGKPGLTNCNGVLVLAGESAEVPQTIHARELKWWEVLTHLVGVVRMKIYYSRHDGVVLRKENRRKVYRDWR